MAILSSSGLLLFFVREKEINGNEDLSRLKAGLVFARLFFAYLFILAELWVKLDE